MTDVEALYVGLMSGTSADAIDAALCTFAPQPRLLSALAFAWPASLRVRVLALGQAERGVELDALGELDTAIGACLADAVEALLGQAGVAADEVRAVGAHGQTVRHRPDGARPFTLQLGNPWVIAERCGIDTVADFRRADMAAGGQGAPLMPAFHAAVLAAPGSARVVLNLGGIANITRLDADGTVTGFDTGPANGLMDAWCTRTRGDAYDRDGALAASGRCDASLLADLLDDPYFQREPPKSTGREHFNLAWLDTHPRVSALQAADVQATLLALTVRSVVRAVRAHAGNVSDVLVCGGGVHNPVLMAGLAEALAPARVGSTASRGIDPDFMEAMGFAWLARQRVLGRAGNLPSVTGARGPRLLGTLCAAPRQD